MLNKHIIKEYNKKQILNSKMEHSLNTHHQNNSKTGFNLTLLDQNKNEEINNINNNTLKRGDINKYKMSIKNGNHSFYITEKEIFDCSFFVENRRKRKSNDENTDIFNETNKNGSICKRSKTDEFDSCTNSKSKSALNKTNMNDSFHSSSSVERSLFKGLVFYIYNFDSQKEEILKDIIMLQQGTIYNNQTPLEINEELLIVTSFARKFDPSFINDFPMKTKLITNYWVEKCILNKKLYDFDECPMFTPCTLKNTITDFQFLNLTVTGFNKFEKLYVKFLILKMGGKYLSSLSRNTTILICHDNNPTSVKYNNATEWNIPAVSIKWLYKCYKEKSFISYDPFEIKK